VPRVSINVQPTVFFLHNSPFPLFDVIVNPNIIFIELVEKPQEIDPRKTSYTLASVDLKNSIFMLQHSLI